MPVAPPVVPTTIAPKGLADGVTKGLSGVGHTFLNAVPWGTLLWVVLAVGGAAVCVLGVIVRYLKRGPVRA